MVRLNSTDDLVPTDEQQAFLDVFPSGQDIVINALAGCAKTSTLEMGARSDPQRRMTYIAFNRAIAEEARRRFAGTAVICKTIHAFAFASVGHRFVDRLNGPRVSAREVADILRLPGRFEYGNFSLRSHQLARLVTEALKRYCHSDAVEPQASHLSKVPGLDSDGARHALAELLLPYVVRAWEDVTSTKGLLRYDPDYYLKLWSFTHPQLPGDVILADEVQDYDMVSKYIIDHQDSSQRVLVGDSYQQIYSYRGSTNCLAMYPDAVHLTLRKTFRFSSAIADEANLILDLLDSDLRLIGHEPVNSKLAILTDPDLVLTRTNAGSIAHLMSAQLSGTRAGLVGGTKQVEGLAKAALDLTEGRKSTHHELIAFDSWDQVRDYVGEDTDTDARELKVLVKLVDRHGARTLLDAVQRAVPEQSADLVISTVHKYKGKQSDRVQIASDFTDPQDPDTLEWNEEELRIAYVAVTRAKKFLDHSSFNWLTEVADEDGKSRDFLPASEVPPREVIPPALARLRYESQTTSSLLTDSLLRERTAQVVPDPEDATRLMFQNTQFNADLINAQRSLARSKFYQEYCGESKVRVVLATPQALEVAERFGLTISQAARDRVAYLSG